MPGVSTNSGLNVACGPPKTANAFGMISLTLAVQWRSGRNDALVSCPASLRARETNITPNISWGRYSLMKRIFMIGRGAGEESGSVTYRPKRIGRRGSRALQKDPRIGFMSQEPRRRRVGGPSAGSGPALSARHDRRRRERAARGEHRRRLVIRPVGDVAPVLGHRRERLDDARRRLHVAVLMQALARRARQVVQREQADDLSAFVHDRQA